MGAAFSFPLLDNNNKVTLTEPYNAKLLNKLLKKKKFHTSLKITLPKNLLIKRFSSQLLFEKWDLIVVAVSSVGIELVKKYLKNLNKKTYLLVLTKGLKFDRKIKKIIIPNDMNLDHNLFHCEVQVIKSIFELEDILKKDFQRFETVLFSCGGSSFNDFENYIERGKFFKSIVKNLKGGQN